MNYMLNLALVTILAFLLLTSCSKQNLDNDSSETEDIEPKSSSIEQEVKSFGEKESSSDIPVKKNLSLPNINPDDWNLLLVNNEHTINPNFEVEIDTIPKKYLMTDNANKIDSRVLPYLLEMLDDAEKDGVEIFITSAYREYSYQVGLFNRKVSEFVDIGYSQYDAEKQAAQYVAIPGSSEHCTGLAVDIVSKNWYEFNEDLNTNFERTKEFIWLAENAENYGFIIRYPKGKVDITQISYEPWHYRYVGVEHAKAINSLDITLEEYLADYYK